MKILLIAIILIFYLFKSYILGVEIGSNDITSDDSNNLNSFSDKLKFDAINSSNKFNKSLKNILKKDETLKEEDISEEKQQLIHNYFMLDLYEKFFTDVINNNVVEFLDNLNKDSVNNNEYQIDLEESCSPFFCEKIMKAKEIKVNTDNNTDMLNNIKDIKEHKYDETSENSKENELNDSNVNESLSENNLVDNIIAFDDNNKEKIILTDGNNVYVLEEIENNDDIYNDSAEMIQNESEKEINLHEPKDYSNTEKNIDLLRDDDEEDDDNNLENDNLLHKHEDKEIGEHSSNVVSDEELRNSNEENNALNDNILTFKGDELSKKILEELKFDNEEKIQCYNFSDNAEKCNSFKKCTYVNIDNKDVCFLDYNFMLFLKNNNCSLQSKSSLLSISKDLLKSGIIDRQLYQLLRNSNNNNFICDSITYSFLTNVIDNTDYDEVFD